MTSARGAADAEALGVSAAAGWRAVLGMRSEIPRTAQPPGARRSPTWTPSYLCEP